MPKRTFRLQIERTDNTQSPNHGVYIPVLTNEQIVLEFQCEAGTTPRLSALTEQTEIGKKEVKLL